MKYINADTVVQALRETIDKHKDSEMFTRTVRAAENMILIIDRMPSADVEKVVRCKDCKRYFEPYCTRFLTGIIPVTETDFCSHGERKDDE